MEMAAHRRLAARWMSSFNVGGGGAIRFMCHHFVERWWAARNRSAVACVEGRGGSGGGPRHRWNLPYRGEWRRVGCPVLALVGEPPPTPFGLCAITPRRGSGRRARSLGRRDRSAAACVGRDFVLQFIDLERQRGWRKVAGVHAPCASQYVESRHVHLATWRHSEKSTVTAPSRGVQIALLFSASSCATSAATGAAVGTVVCASGCASEECACGDTRGLHAAECTKRGCATGAPWPGAPFGPPRAASGPPRAASGPPRAASGPPRAASGPPRAASG